MRRRRALRERAADAAELREDASCAEGDALRELLEKLSALALVLAAPGGTTAATTATAAAVDVVAAARALALPRSRR